MVRLLSVLYAALLILACEKDPVSGDDTQASRQLLLNGFVLDGRGGAAGPQVVSWRVLPLGCAATVLVERADTGSHGWFADTADAKTLPGRVCITVSARPHHVAVTDSFATVHARLDSVTIQADGITVAEITLRYDFAILTAAAHPGHDVGGGYDALRFDLVTPQGTHAVVGKGSLRMKVDSGVVVTLHARYNWNGATAQVSHSAKTWGDTRVGFSVITSKVDPTRLCMGCTSKASAVIRRADGTATADSLHVVWGGGLPISHDAVLRIAPEQTAAAGRSQLRRRYEHGLLKQK